MGHVVSVMYRFKAKRVFAEKAGIWINHVADAFEETFISYMYCISFYISRNPCCGAVVIVDAGIL